eukprot:COSAG03_NODE_266_length_9692_cov_13.725216_4_plen_118_part_00
MKLKMDGTLQSFLKVAETMESHRASGVAWSKLGRNISVELALDPARRAPAADFLAASRAEYDQLTEQSPAIDDSVIAMFKARFSQTCFSQFSLPMWAILSKKNGTSKRCGCGSLSER